MDAQQLVERVGAYVDARHPQVVRAVLGVRWGGLRTVELDPTGWTAVLAAGAVAGGGVRAAGRAVAERAGAPRRRSWRGALAAVAAGAVASWFAVWRWDTRRWRRRHVALTVDLPPDELAALADRLAEVAPVETWEDPVGPDGTRRGLLVPVRDVRAVNTALGAPGGWSARG